MKKFKNKICLTVLINIIVYNFGKISFVRMKLLKKLSLTVLKKMGKIMNLGELISSLKH